MILITDSGSSKCTWCFVRNTGQDQRITTTGINPSTQDREKIGEIIRDELLPTLHEAGAFFGEETVEQIFFYGAGCTESKRRFMEDLLHEYWKEATVEVCSDMVGAARSLWHEGQGIACILGTGANSCLYDGRQIIAQTPALGYILGDEGGGAYLGKMLVRAVLKGKLPEKVRQDFFLETGLTMERILDRTYKEPMANRFLASLTPFLHKHRKQKELQALIHSAFTDFIHFNLEAYRQYSNRASFVGSIAFYFQEELEACLKKHGFELGSIVKDPMDGLKSYHAKGDLC